MLGKYGESLNTSRKKLSTFTAEIKVHHQGIVIYLYIHMIYTYNIYIHIIYIYISNICYIYIYIDPRPMIHLVHIRAHISIRSLNKFHHRLVPFSPTQGCHPGIRRKNCWRTSAIPATGTVMPHETSAEHGGTCWKRSKNIKSKLEHGVVHGPKTAWC